jgi:hypothetical protein
VNRTRRREIKRARFVESAEAIAGLADAPFRAARRTGNDPVSLSVLATTVGGFRVRVRNAATWLDDHHPREARVYRSLVDLVEQDVIPKLSASLEPDSVMGAERTASGRFDAAPEVRRAVRAWSRQAKRHNRGYGLPMGIVVARVARTVSGGRSQ